MRGFPTPACPTNQDVSLSTSLRRAESQAGADPQCRLVARGMGGHQVKDRGRERTSERHCTITAEELSVQHQVNACALFNTELMGVAQRAGI